jgi:plastocyanin
MQPRIVWTRPGPAALVLACVIAACEIEAHPTGPLRGRREVAESGPGRSAEIRLYDNLPEPGNLTAYAGQQVEWKNVGANPHSVSTYGTPDEWEDTLLQPGQSFVHVFDEPGEYAYVCIVHGEVGNVSVVEDPSYMDPNP